MKVVAILGGLGSQMIKYAFYLYIKRNTNDDCYIDTSFFKYQDSWNGYELKKLFNISDIDVADNIENTNGRWYPGDALTFMIEHTQKDCIYLNRGIPCKWPKFLRKENIFSKTYKKIALYLQRIVIGRLAKYHSGVGEGDLYHLKFIQTDHKKNIYFDEFDHRSDRYFCNMQDELKKIFTFPKLDERNQAIANEMNKNESVALHIRRSDHMYDNEHLYKRNYFAKAVSLVKEKGGESLTFYLFSDDISWCLENLNEIGLDEHDKIIPINWNLGQDSYKDMQLMTFCQHNIIPISSFSWWGAYLSNRQDKITVAPIGHGMNMQYHL